eukprot:632677-Hanusia_phi.AAC.1
MDNLFKRDAFGHVIFVASRLPPICLPYSAIISAGPGRLACDRTVRYCHGMLPIQAFSEV